MSIPDWILGLFLIFLIVAVCVVACQPLLPIFHRISLDQTCKYYFEMMVRNASVDGIGLTDEQNSELNAELRSKGFSVQLISASQDVTWGDDIEMNVTVTRDYRELQGDLTYKTKTLTMKYHERSKALGI